MFVVAGVTFKLVSTDDGVDGSAVREAVVFAGETGVVVPAGELSM